MSEIMENDKSSIIKSITCPLGFFALSLLIVEGFLTIVLIFSDLEPDKKFVGMIIGAFLFVLVVVLVWWLVKNRPENLTFGERSHLEKAKMMNIWGTSDDPQKAAEIADDKKIISTSSTPTTTPVTTQDINNNL